MLSLRDAIRIVEERQTAVMGERIADEPPGTVVFSDNDSDDKAILSGYDVDYHELLAVIDEMALLYSEVAYYHGLQVAFRAAISYAFQVGLVKGADSRA